MASDYRPPRSMGSLARRGVQLLGGALGFVGYRASISAEDAAFASPAAVLQGGVVIGSGFPDVVRGALHRPRPCHGYRGCCGSSLYSLAVCSSELREGARR